MTLLRNTLYSAAGSGVPLLVTILTLPLLVAEIGLERYGALALAWLFVSYFTSADFGIGRAVTQRVATARADDGAQDGLGTIVLTGLASVFALSALLGAALYVSASWYFSSQLQVSPAVRDEVIASVWMLALSAPVLGTYGVLAGALMGVERFGRVSISAVISNTSMQVMPLLVALLHGPDLRFLLAGALLAKFAGLAVLIGPVRRIFLRDETGRFSRAEAKRLSQFGVWVFVSVLVGSLIIYLDRLTIGAIAGAFAAAAYAIPFQIANRTMLVPFAVSQAVFPRLAGDTEDVARRRGRDATLLMLLIYTPIAVLLICLTRPLLQLWLGEALDPRSITVAHIVMLGCWINAASTVAFSYLQARGHPRFTGLLHVIELPFYFLMLVFLGNRFGLAGFAAAFALRCLADSVVLLVRSRLIDGRTMVRIGALGAFVVCAFLSSRISDSLAQDVLTGLALGCGSTLLAVKFLPASVISAVRSNGVLRRLSSVRIMATDRVRTNATQQRMKGDD